MTILFNGTTITDITLDESGRFEVDPISYYGAKNVQLFNALQSLDLNELENALDIQQRRPSFHTMAVTLDTWEEVVNKVQDLRELHQSPTHSATIFGYELVHDNHYIKLYYNISSHNS